MFDRERESKDWKEKRMPKEKFLPRVIDIEDFWFTAERVWIGSKKKWNLISRGMSIFLG